MRESRSEKEALRSKIRDQKLENGDSNCGELYPGVGGRGRRPLESADPRGPACGAPERLCQVDPRSKGDSTPGCGQVRP